jgi:hypothetical protein
MNLVETSYISLNGRLAYRKDNTIQTRKLISGLKAVLIKIQFWFINFF